MSHTDVHAPLGPGPPFLLRLSDGQSRVYLYSAPPSPSGATGQQVCDNGAI